MLRNYYSEQIENRYFSKKDYILFIYNSLKANISTQFVGYMYVMYSEVIGRLHPIGSK